MQIAISMTIVFPATCEVLAMIGSLCAKESPAAEIHSGVVPTVMCEEKIRQWCRGSENGRTKVQDEGLVFSLTKSVNS